MLVLLALARTYPVGKNTLWMLPKSQHRSKSWWENFEDASCQCTSFCSLPIKDFGLPHEGNSCQLKYPTRVNSACKVLPPREMLAALEQLSSTSTRPAKQQECSIYWWVHTGKGEDCSERSPWQEQTTYPWIILNPSQYFLLIFTALVCYMSPHPRTQGKAERQQQPMVTEGEIHIIPLLNQEILTRNPHS